MKYYTISKISENIHETPEGYLICIGVPIARTGEMIYGEGETPLETGDDGQVKIHRDPEEVFRPETIASFEGKPLTITHPQDFVDPKNWSRLAKGVLKNVRRGAGDQENDLIADLLITDDVAINLVKNGLREVSCGYEAEYTQSGEGRGIQTNIVGNHLALVEQGRAGSAYAINDHKGANKMTIKDKIKSIFAKAQDEAMKAAEDAEEKKPDDKKDESKDAMSLDELVKAVKDLGEKVMSMGKPKDAEEKKDDMKDKPKDEEKKPDDKKEESGDEEVAPSVEDRLKALEAQLAALLEDKSEEMGDEYGEEKEESSDDDFEESTMVGDTASRAEILAPGIKHTKDVKLKALKAAYETKEGKKVIDAVSGGKPTFDSAERIDTLFIAASELLKVSRTSELSKAKQATVDGKDGSGAPEPMTADRMNEINAKFYNRN